jgi:hypothetical protein
VQPDRKTENSVEQRVDKILSQMTLLQKLSYIGGTGFFDIKPIPVSVGPLNRRFFKRMVRMASEGIRQVSGSRPD